MEIPKHLTIFVPPEYITNITETGEVTATFGETLDFIKLIAKGLGCSYKVYSFDLWDGSNGNLYIGGLPIIIQNYLFMSHPYAATDVTFAIEKPPLRENTFAFLQTFSLSLWFGLLLCVILASFIHFLLFWRKISFMSALFYVVGTLVGEHHNWRPKSMAQKMLILTWNIGIMFITLSYGSVLLSFLTVPLRDKGITDFDGLYEAVRLQQATAVKYEYTDIDAVMIESEDTKLRFLGEHLKLQNDINYYTVLRKIKHNVAVISTRRELSSTFTGDKYFISEDSILQYYLAFYDLEEPPFCCMKRVNDVILRIWAAGINTKMEDDTEFKLRMQVKLTEQKLRVQLKDKYKNKVQDPIRPLSLADLSGAFYFLIIGHILGLICFVFEIFAHHCPYKI